MMIAPRILLAAGILLVLSSYGRGQEAGHIPSRPGAAAKTESMPSVGAITAEDIERDKLDLDYKKFDFELEKHRDNLAIERTKAWISGLSIVIPLLVVAATIVFGVITQDREARRARMARQEEAQSDFEIKVAEAVIGAPGPEEAYNRALLLKSLFPLRLPKNFADQFNPAKHGRLNSPDGKKEFLRLVAANLTHRMR